MSMHCCLPASRALYVCSNRATKIVEFCKLCCTQFDAWQVCDMVRGLVVIYAGRIHTVIRVCPYPWLLELDNDTYVEPGAVSSDAAPLALGNLVYQKVNENLGLGDGTVFDSRLYMRETLVTLVLMGRLDRAWKCSCRDSDQDQDQDQEEEKELGMPLYDDAVSDHELDAMFCVMVKANKMPFADARLFFACM